MNLEENLEELKKIGQKNLEDISNSVTFLGICSNNYVEDPICLIQFALCIFLDKPLYLLIEKGTKVPKKLIRLLDGYEFYKRGDSISFKVANEKLLKKVKKKIKNIENDKFK